MSQRNVRALALVAGLVLVAIACKPYFPEGSTLTVTPLGPLATLTWSPATEADEGQVVALYEISVDGSVVATVPATTTTCVLTGLDAGATAEIEVRAYDDTGEWSGDIGGDATALGRLAASYTNDAAVGGGAPGCVDPADGDGDRLPDAVESDTGSYVDPSDTGTDPADTDTDDDAIGDGDEVLGTEGGFELPALGTTPTRKDIVLEMDWMDDNADSGTCAAHSHEPTAGMIAKVQTAFAAAPVANPDGTTGISLIADYGQGGAFTGGNLVPDADGVIAGGVGGPEYTGIKAANLAPERNGYVHYVLLPHRYNTNSTSSGQAEVNGDDMIVSLYCFGSDQNVANTVVHELGHNLSLRHGGDENVNHKPNYNSVMNYLYQFPGIDDDCTVAGNGVLGLSVGDRADLDENALFEAAGICDAVAVDWDGSGGIDAGAVAVDINGDGQRTVLHDHDDWGALVFGGIGDGDGARLVEPELIDEQPVPEHARGG